MRWERQPRPKIKGEMDMESTFKKRYPRFVALLAAGIIAAIGAAHARDWRDDDNRLAQVTELEQLHATFHAAVSVHDPVNGDSPAVITQRIRDILAFWTKDAELTIVNTTDTAGNYIGNGDPDDPASCPLPSGESIQMRYTTDGKESTEAYTADEKERTVNENQGGEVVVKAKWKGPVLNIERIARLELPNDPLFNGSEVIHDEERWKLSADGRILTVEEKPRRVSIYEKMPI
jgi:hypothetical protein